MLALSKSLTDFYQNTFHEKLEPEEWQYQMRRTMQEIIPGLFLGPYSSATRSNLPVLEAAGISHIVCVRQEIESSIIKTHFTDRIRYLTLDIADLKTENILRFFPQSNAFIEECLSKGGKCLVHSNAGISRSATLVMAYLMQKYNLKKQEAFRLVQCRRFCIGPNEAFLSQLSEYEPIYRASQETEHDSRQKRKFDQVDPSPRVDTIPTD